MWLRAGLRLRLWFWRGARTKNLAQAVEADGLADIELEQDKDRAVQRKVVWRVRRRSENSGVGGLLGHGNGRPCCDLTPP